MNRFHAVLLLSALSQISAPLDRECRFIRSAHIPLSAPSNKRRHGGEIDIRLHECIKKSALSCELSKPLLLQLFIVVIIIILILFSNAGYKNDKDVIQLYTKADKHDSSKLSYYVRCSINETERE